MFNTSMYQCAILRMLVDARCIAVMLTPIISTSVPQYYEYDAMGCVCCMLHAVYNMAD